VIIGVADDAEGRTRARAFEEGLRDHNLIDGRDVRVDYRWSGGSRDRAHDAAVELLGAGAEVIVADSTPVVALVSRATSTVPIVFVHVSDPLGSGIVSSMARPGGNVTGFSNFEFAIGGKWMEIVKSLSPPVSRVFVLFNPRTAPYGTQYVSAVSAAAQAFAIETRIATAQEISEIQPLIEAMLPLSEALIVAPDIFTGAHHRHIIETANSRRLVAVYPFKYFARAGGLCSYGIDPLDLFRRAAGYVSRIIAGTAAGELPVQAPTKFELAINVTTASALGIGVPPLLLARADEVIE